MGAKNFKDLIAWQRGMDLVEMVYAVTKNFPAEELYGLTSQLRRAAVSIPSNIAEGQGRSSAGDFLRFLTMAYGSLREVETQLLIAVRLKYLGPSDLEPIQKLCDETGRLLNGLMNSLRKE
jgi:four helix bundle protein